MIKCRKTGIWLIMLACAMLIVTSGPGICNAAKRQTITLRVVGGHPLSEGDYWIYSLQHFFIPEVEKRVLERTDKYKVVMRGFYGGSVAKLGEVLEAVQGGLADIGYVLPLTEMSAIDPFNVTFWIPFSSPHIDSTLKAYIKTVDHFPIFNEMLAKYNQKLLGNAFCTTDSYQIVSNVPIRTLNDLKGLKLAHAGSFLPMIAALGATPVQSVYTDMYTSIDTGVYNGFVIAPTAAYAFKIYEVAKYLLKLDLGAQDAGILTINLNTWKKLPKEVQDILIETGNDYSWDVAKHCKMLEAKAWARMKKAGVHVYTLPESERIRWAHKVNNSGIIAKAVRADDARGWPGNKIAEFYIKALEEQGYKFPYKPKLE